MFKDIYLVQALKDHFPQWSDILIVLLLPVLWIFPLQRFLIPFAWGDGSLFADILKRIFLLLPAILIVAGCWCTMLSVYTLPFRPGRTLYIQVIFLTWWDSGRSIWMFWAGIIRFLAVIVVWAWQLGRMIVSNLFVLIKQLLLFPFNLVNNMSRRYFRPGVPWIAVLLTFLWVTLEALIFTYILRPTVTEILSDIVGVETHQFLTPILYIFLFLLIAGSYSCLQVLIEALASRKIKDILQMVVIEVFVMFMEVFFFYRELVDSLAPWIYQQSGFQPGLVSTLLISSFGWVGIRGMTWFLFGRFGTPTLLAIIARRPMNTEPDTARKGGAAQTNLGNIFFTSEQLAMFHKESEWFTEKGRELMETLLLPPLQVLAAVINFAMVLVSSRPLFSLPFGTIREALDTKELLKMLEEKRENIVVKKMKKAQNPND